MLCGSQRRAAREAAAVTATGSAPVTRKSIPQPCQAAPISVPDRLAKAITASAGRGPSTRVARLAPVRCSITPCSGAVLNHRSAARASAAASSTRSRVRPLPFSTRPSCPAWPASTSSDSASAATWIHPGTTGGGRSTPCPASAGQPDAGAGVEQFGEERQVQRLLEEADPAGAAGALLETDDPHHRAHVAEPPQLELALDVHQVLAQRVLAPAAVGVGVDRREHPHQRVVVHMRQAPVAIQVPL